VGRGLGGGVRGGHGGVGAAQRARGESSGGESLGEWVRGSPAGAMRGRDDTRADQPVEIVDGDWDTPLHCGAREVVAADHDVDRHAGKLALRGETDIDDACMRTRGQDAHTSPAYLGCDESLVENERIRTTEVAPEGHVTL